MLQKANDETRGHDKDSILEKFPLSRAVLVDNGYQGEQNRIRTIHPVRQAPVSL